MSKKACRFALVPARLFLPCFAGMTVGLAIDCGPFPPELLASLCRSSVSPLATVALHWSIFPAMHTLMLFGAVAACVMLEWNTTLPRRGVVIRACAHGACVMAMFVGMAFGGTLGPLLSARFGVSGFPGLMAGMLAGMIGGMMLTTPLYALRAFAGIR